MLAAIKYLHTCNNFRLPVLREITEEKQTPGWTHTICFEKIYNCCLMFSFAWKGRLLYNRSVNLKLGKRDTSHFKRDTSPYFLLTLIHYQTKLLVKLLVYLGCDMVILAYTRITSVFSGQWKNNILNSASNIVSITLFDMEKNHVYNHK